MRRRSRPSTAQPSCEVLEVRTLLSFAAPITFPAGTSPTSIAVGDFTSDGQQDVVAVNTTSLGTVSVLPGNGDGTFGTPIVSAAGIAPVGATVADLNGDGRLDLVTHQSGAASIEILFGNGNGTFQAPIVDLLGASPTQIEAGDVDQDGDVDLFASSFGYGGTVFLLLNNGDGSFQAPRNLAAGANAMDVEVADFDGDHNLDLVMANQVSAGTISVSLGNGDGTFRSARAYSAGSAPYRMTVGDYNNDGHPDVAVLNTYSSPMMSVVLGNGDGSFQPYTSYTLGYSNSLETADFNNDGNVDLLAGSGQVSLGRGDGSFYAPVVYSNLQSNDAAIGDFNNDGFADIASGAANGSLNVQVNSANDRSILGGAVGLVISAPATVVAGTSFNVTVTAVDADGNVVPGFLGTVGLKSSNPLLGAQAVSYTFTAADAGVHTIVNATATFKAGLQEVRVTTPFLPVGTTPVLVTPAAAHHIALSAPATTVAGAPVAVGVTMLDAYGNVATNYTGTVKFSSSDVQAGLPADYTFTAADAGQHAFNVALKTAGSRTVSAVDTSNVQITGASASVTVTAGPATHLQLLGGGGYVGSAHSVAVMAVDAFGNVDGGYNGTVHLTSSDAATVLPADSALTSSGVGSLTVTPFTLGDQLLSAVDVASGTLVGTETVTVTPGWATRFVATPLATSSVAGTAQSLKLTAYDAFGNVSTVYFGTVVFSSSDLQLGLGSYAFTAADAGVHTFTLALKTAGTQSVSISDSVDSTIRVAQSGLVVTPAAAKTLATTAIQGVVAGTAQNFTVTLRDAYGNIATGYRGTLAFTSGDVLAALPTNYTFTAADAGVHTFSMTFKSSGGQTLTVQDTVTATLVSNQTDISINAAAMTGFSIKSPSSATVGTAFSITVKAVDAFGNTVKGYLGKVHFTGPGGTNLLPADYTFTATDAGAHIFTITLTSTGTQTVGFQDKVTGALKGSLSVKVSTGGGSGGGGGG
ncbi:MAG: VCBS repeat-containing protein, partial [Planctomycetota bacterium]|nr:VCBS repeat-containing protein [Planctomycetota bacterium]